ncbi:peptidoglycan-associated lipoprotein Pal [Asticcacaulis sp. AC402]|uniref:peptidoglycan-associated lipoprotein Pal n=1 Tax=Asticcacaulis sp. AC402 TaxID=1282361 RepID=UPI0003C3B8C9|nr:peptidoglycan-associated lipoprotein Pal [Asticcacaulis sp. AC402]ESQ75546.1 OmpA family protein [Asticcacaulis sp. AC402]
MNVSMKSIVKVALVAFVMTSVAACTKKEVAPPPTVTPPVATTPAPKPTTPVPPAATALPPVGVAPGSQQDFIVNVGDRVYFDTDQSSIRSDAEGVLAAQAAWLIRYPSVKVRIEGNADERGTREYNFALGARRAQSVADFLTSKGVVPSRISTISYGKEQPIATGADEESWQQNRNSHTAIVSGAN